MIVYRSVKGDELEHHEVDENFKYLDEKSIEYVVGHVYRGPVLRMFSNQLYRLVDTVVFPYTANDFSVELTAGDWVLVDSSSQFTDQLISAEGIIVDGTDIFVPAGVSGQINGALYTTLTDETLPTELCTAGFVRKDILVLTTDNEVISIPGTETDGPIVLAEPTPINTLYITTFDVSDSEIGIPETPLIGASYVKKQFASYAKFNGIGEDAIIALHPQGNSEIHLLNSGLVSIAGFDLSLIESNPAAEVPYRGKEIVLWNRTPNPITIKHLFGLAPLDVILKNAEDLIIPANERLNLNYTSFGLYETLRSWVDLSGIGGSGDISLSFIPFSNIAITVNEQVAGQGAFSIMNTNVNVTKSGSLITGPAYEIIGQYFVKSGNFKKLNIRYFADGAAGNCILRLYAFKQNHGVNTIYDVRLLFEKTLTTSSPYTMQIKNFVAADFNDSVINEGEFMALTFQQSGATALSMRSASLNLLY